MDLKAEIQKQKPFFLEQKIRFWDTEEFSRLEPFIIETTWEDSTSINIFLVEGTRHPDYKGLTWLEFLDKGKRMQLNLDLFRTNPDYYLGTDHKMPTMSYLQLDGGPYFVDADGNHRTCIAKIFFFLQGLTMLHGVTVTRHRVDRDAMELYGRLLKRFRFVRPWKRKLSREDTAGWMRETFEPVFEVVDKRGRVFNLSKDDALTLLSQSHSTFLGKLVNLFRRNIPGKGSQNHSKGGDVDECRFDSYADRLCRRDRYTGGKVAENQKSKIVANIIGGLDGR